MTKKRGRETESKLLTEAELELMTIIWRLGEGSVADVIDGLPSDRPLAYTSVSTILRILEQKGVLRARKEGRGHVYEPLLAKSDYEAKAVRQVVERVFDGAPVALVRRLLGSDAIGEQELSELKALIAAAEARK